VKSFYIVRTDYIRAGIAKLAKPRKKLGAKIDLGVPYEGKTIS
jgi:hypothetical protein